MLTRTISNEVGSVDTTDHSTVSDESPDPQTVSLSGEVTETARAAMAATARMEARVETSMVRVRVSV